MITTQRNNVIGITFRMFFPQVMNNKNIDIQIEFTEELQYLKRQKTELHCTLIINRMLSSVNVDHYIVTLQLLFLVWFLPHACFNKQMPEDADACLRTVYSFSPSLPVSFVPISVTILPTSVLFELMSHNHDRLNLLGNVELLASIGLVISWQQFSVTDCLEQATIFFSLQHQCQ